MPRPIRRQVFSLALPVVLSSLLHRAVGIIDIFLVGGLGASAIAAVGMSQIMVFLSMSVAWGINIGTTVVVSQLWGAGRKPDAAQAAFQSLLLVIIAAGCISALGLLFSDDIARFLGADGEVRIIVSDYTRIIFSFIFFTIAINVLSGIMHGAGDTRTPLYSTILVNVLHVAIAYPLIYGKFGAPAIGVKGAAIAIAASEGAGVTFLIIRSLVRHYVRVKRKIEPKYSLMTLKLGFPVFIDRILQNTGSLMFAKVVLLYGTAVYAAHQVGLAIESFSFMPGYGISIAAATLVGQKLGADRPADARLSAFEARRLAVVLMATMGLIFFFFPYALLRAFTNDPDVIRYGVLYMKIVAFSQIPLALTMVVGGSLRGAGDTRFIMFATIAGMWLVRLPVASILAVIFELPVLYVWSAMVLDWITRMGLLLWRYHRQTWGKLEL